MEKLQQTKEKILTNIAEHHNAETALMWAQTYAQLVEAERNEVIANQLANGAHLLDDDDEDEEFYLQRPIRIAH